MIKGTPLVAILSLPELAKRHLLVVVLVENLCRGKLEIFLCDVHSSLSESVHACFRTHTLQLGTGAPVHLFRDLGEVDTTGEVHLAAVNAENIGSGLDAGRGELDLSVDTSWAQEGRVENVETIGGHDDLDVLRGFETIELVKQLKHSSLDFGISS